MGKTFSKYCCGCFTSSEDPMLPEKFVRSDQFPSPSTKSSDDFFSSDKENHMSDPDEIDTARLIPNSYQDFIMIAFSEFAEFLSIPESALQLIKSTADIKVFGREDSSGYSLKSEWCVNYTPREFLDYYYLVEEKAKWDKNILSIQEIENSVIYVVFKKFGIVSQRDLLFTYAEFEHEGGLACVTTSIEHPLFPEQKNIVRVNMNFGGYFAKEIEPGLTKVVAINKCDIGGSIPKAIVKSLTALNLPKLANAMNTSMNAFYAIECARSSLI